MNVMDLRVGPMKRCNPWSGITFLVLNIITLCHFHSDVIFLHSENRLQEHGERQSRLPSQQVSFVGFGPTLVRFAHHPPHAQ
jgi:hypothetical protein